MRRIQLLAWIAVLGIAAVLNADEESRDEAKQKEKEKSTEVAAVGPDRTALPKIYIPPARGATRTRTGGGTRGISRLPKVVALVPDHVALTARPAPELSWYISADAERPLVLTLLRDDAIDPDLEKTIAEQVAAGIGGVSLVELGVELEPGVVYKWSVALVADPDSWEHDVVASGAIERVPAPPGLDEAADYRELAANGLWYDALAELDGAIDAGDAERAIRAQLLDEVGLSSAADYERGVR